MTLTEEALEYARTHLQAVRICWLDRHTEIYGAVEAVALCADRSRAGRIVGVVAQDKWFEDMLNKLIDEIGGN